MPVTVTLANPVRFGDESIAALTLREPTGRDLRSLGMPITGEDLNTPVMHAWIAQLAAQPEPLIDMLSLSDWMQAAAAVSGFFRAPATPAKTS